MFGQAFFILTEYILNVPSYLLHLPRNVLKEALLNDFPRDQSTADCLFPTALLSFLEDENTQLSIFKKIIA